MKLVHWPLMGGLTGLLHLVQREGDWAGQQPAQAPPRCTKCNIPPINGQSRHQCSASQNILLVPRYKRSGLGQRAFSVAGPLVWNSIADCLRDPALELASFKRQLKTFLFARY